MLRSHLVWCFWLNILATLLAVALLYYPTVGGFTVTSVRQTRYIQGGQLPAALLMISTNFLIAVYLVYRVYKTAIL